MRPPRLRCTLFPLIYPPHLLVLPATLGLHLFWQTYPYFRASYVISVRRTKSLPTASFRFHLTVDTLAVQLYTSSLPRRVRDFHPLERAHGAQSKKEPLSISGSFCFIITCLPSQTIFLFFFLKSLHLLRLPEKIMPIQHKLPYCCGRLYPGCLAYHYDDEHLVHQDHRCLLLLVLALVS